MTPTDLIARLRTPPFGTETSERNLMTAAADALTVSQEELAHYEAHVEAHVEALESECDRRHAALTAMQERIEALEEALSAAIADLDAWVSHGDDLRSSGYDVDYTAAVARQARAALDATGKGDG